MKSLAFLEHVDHTRKAAIYAAAHDGRMRNFAYHEGLGECRETFSRLLQDVQKGEIGVILTPDAACLSIETSPDWMEAFIQAVKQHEVLIGDHSHDLVYDLRDAEDEAQFRGLYPQGEYEQARSAPRPLVDAIAQSPFAAAYIERGENWFLVTRFESKDPDAEARGRHGRAISCCDGAAPGFPAQRRAREGDPAWEREGAGQAKTETRRKKPMRERSYFTHEEYQLTKVALERSDVPAEALALLSTWIEGEGLLVDDREDVGGIDFCRMDARVMAPLPHIVASFFARRPYKRKAGHYPNWNGFYLLLYRDMEEGWKLVQIRRNTSFAQFVPLFAARIKAVEEINKLRGKE